MRYPLRLVENHGEQGATGGALVLMRSKRVLAASFRFVCELISRSAVYGAGVPTNVSFTAFGKYFIQACCEQTNTHNCKHSVRKIQNSWLCFDMLRYPEAPPLEIHAFNAVIELAVSMAEVITETQPRIKFLLQRDGDHALDHWTSPLQALTTLMVRLEDLGAAPVLCDGKVGGNCCIREPAAMEAGASSSAADADAVLVSRSGKDAGVELGLSDFVRVTSFDRDAWAARYASADEALRPSSDSPLLCACVSRIAASRYGWQEATPNVAIHGHALEAGAGEPGMLYMPATDACCLSLTASRRTTHT